jgi:hypothetical protein
VLMVRVFQADVILSYAVVEAANLNIDFLYAAWDRTTGRPMIVLHTEDLAVLESILRSKGYRSLSRSGKQS